MTARILLVRHGPSAHAHDGRWMHRYDVPRFEDAYDAAGIRDDPPPPAQLRSVAATAGVVCASDLRRAIESASRVAPGGELVVLPLLREVRRELHAPATVLVVTHDGMRRLIADRLSAHGWLRAPEKRSYANWSAWEYTR